MHTEMRHIARPPALKKAGQRDRSKYCKYHGGYGHTTEQCVWLRDVIQDLLQQGKLSEYKREERRTDSREPRGRRHSYSPRRRRSPRRERSPSQKVPPPQERGKEKEVLVPQGPSTSHHANPPESGSQEDYVVNVIAGGFAGGGEKKADRRKYLKQVFSVCQEKKKATKTPPLSFSDNDLQTIIPDHDDPMVIVARIGRYQVERLLVDQGSSADILFLPALSAMKLKVTDLSRTDTTLIGFTGDEVQPLGQIYLPVSMGEGPSTRTEMIKFIVVDCPSAYNGILGRRLLRSFGAVVSTVHLAMKFVGKDLRVVTVRADQKMARKCYNISLSMIKDNEAKKT